MFFLKQLEEIISDNKDKVDTSYLSKVVSAHKDLTSSNPYWCAGAASEFQAAVENFFSKHQDLLLELKVLPGTYGDVRVGLSNLTGDCVAGLEKASVTQVKDIAPQASKAYLKLSDAGNYNFNIYPKGSAELHSVLRAKGDRGESEKLLLTIERILTVLGYALAALTDPSPRCSDISYAGRKVFADGDCLVQEFATLPNAMLVRFSKPHSILNMLALQIITDISFIKGVYMAVFNKK